MEELLHKELTNKIISCFYTVYNTLGFGFLEKVYENSLMIELKNVADSIIVELKAAEFLIEEHELQLINYLKGTDKEIGLLLNFGKKPEFRRKIFTNDKKRIVHG